MLSLASLMKFNSGDNPINMERLYLYIKAGVFGIRQPQDVDPLFFGYNKKEPLS